MTTLIGRARLGGRERPFWADADRRRALLGTLLVHAVALWALVLVPPRELPFQPVTEMVLEFEAPAERPLEVAEELPAAPDSEALPGLDAAPVAASPEAEPLAAPVPAAPAPEALETAVSPPAPAAVPVAGEPAPVPVGPLATPFALPLPMAAPAPAPSAPVDHFETAPGAPVATPVAAPLAALESFRALVEVAARPPVEALPGPEAIAAITPAEAPDTAGPLDEARLDAEDLVAEEVALPEPVPGAPGPAALTAAEPLGPVVSSIPVALPAPAADSEPTGPTAPVATPLSAPVPVASTPWPSPVAVPATATPIPVAVASAPATPDAGPVPIPVEVDSFGLPVASGPVEAGPVSQAPAIATPEELPPAATSDPEPPAQVATGATPPSAPQAAPALTPVPVSGPAGRGGPVAGQEEAADVCVVVVDARGLQPPFSASPSPRIVDSSGATVWPDEEAIAGVGSRLVDETGIALFFASLEAAESAGVIPDEARVLRVTALRALGMAQAPSTAPRVWVEVADSDARALRTAQTCLVVFLR